MFRSGSLSNMNAAGMSMGHVGGMWMIDTQGSSVEPQSAQLMRC